MSATPELKIEEDAVSVAASSPAPLPGEDTPEAGEDTENDKKRRKPAPKAAPKKPSEEVLQRRREGRIKAAATIKQNLKKTGIGRFEDENGFTLTSVKAIPLINQKNYFAEYLKRDDQIMVVRNRRFGKPKEVKKDDNDDDDDDDDDNDNDDNDDNEEAVPDRAKQGTDTVVIHPGSRYLRVGRATDADPVEIPMVVGVRQKDAAEGGAAAGGRKASFVPDDEGNFDFGDRFAAMKALVTKDFKARMRFYKRRMVPNSRESAASFNRVQRPETVPDNSDPDHRDFFAADDLPDVDFVAGQDALRLPTPQWRLRCPIVGGTFNQADYGLQQEFLGDLTRIVMEAIRAIGASDPARMKCLLLIPDFYEKRVVETWVDVLLRSVGFGRVGVIQEAVAATFGLGVSCACVVDVGAQKTTIACVDEGLVINDSRVSLDYGGDHITETFTKLLLQQQFPIRDVDLLSRGDDWELMDRLKRNFCTVDDADVAVQLYNFYCQRAGGPTEKYNLKVFDEVMLAPLGLFYPDIFGVSHKPKEKRLFPQLFDQYTGELNNPYSKAHDNLIHGEGYLDLTDEKVLLRLVDDKQAFKQANAAYAKPAPEKSATVEDASKTATAALDKAIIESITNAGIATDFTKAKKMYDNLLVVGGGLAKLPGFDTLLNDRINIWRPRFLSTDTLDEILTYVGKEREALDAKRKQMVAAAKQSKKEAQNTQEDVELTAEELREIEEATELSVDLEKADAVADRGLVIPVNILPAPKELDPQMIAWKGGSVYARLKVVNEMWIERADWEMLNSRCLYYKSLFNY